MPCTPIRKTRGDSKLTPNLLDYDAACANFSWDEAARALDGLPAGRGLNIAHEAVDRHAAGALCDKPAIRWIGKGGDVHDFTFGQLGRLSNRFANVLARLGVDPGERVYLLLGRVPELYVTALGTWKNRGILSLLFSAFGPEPIKARLAIGEAAVLVTTESLYRRKVAPIRDSLPSLKHIIVIGDDRRPTDLAGTLDYNRLMDAALDRFAIGPTDPELPALLHFTSGTTGTPKGAVHVHQAVVAHHTTGKLALDLHPEDIFWCTADPGWVTGTSYGIIAPLTGGVTSIVDEGDFDADRWYRLLEEQHVTVWYTAPTAIRVLMKVGADVARKYDLSALRFLASVGEPLNPEAVVWGHEALGLPFHDNWWQTETGGIMIANYASMEIRPGSMGRPLPGIEAAIVRAGDKGRVEVIDEPNVEGELALRPGWPSMFRAYWNAPERYEKCFAGGYYLTGDLARRDSDGYFWFVGRKDDVIKTSGHLVGPFEVESTFMEHPAVAEAGVIGKPDPVAGEVIKAFLSLHDGYEPTDALRRELLGFARVRLGAAIAPKEIQFVETLPRTRSGKIMRRLLKARELGLPEGDTSMLESGATSDG
ncbi:MAG: acetate--CoA ligase [Pirellulales bacterium]